MKNNKLMELNKNEILQVFKHNFSFEIIETALGTAIKMPSRTVFIFSVVTGAGYFDNPVYPFTPKGLMKLFYNAFDYKFVTGIFENTNLKNTPYILSKAKPFLFDTDFKFIVPIEFNSEIELQQILETQFEQLENPTDYLILRIEKSKNGNGMESFMEYLASEYFKKQGFIVENQIPLAHSIGSPDFGGYAIHSILENVKGFLPNGFHIIELAMLRNFKKPENAHTKNATHNLIVGEAKTSTKQMTKQLEKYLDTNLFEMGLEIHPQKQTADKNYFGLFTLNKNLKVQYTTA